MKIIGCDFHPSYQQIALVDTETGELQEARLEHERGEARRFYEALRGQQVRVGMEAVGNSQWFERLLEELAHPLWIGDAAQIRRLVVRQQKTDRRDARHILQLLLDDRFPRLWVPNAEMRDLRQLLRHRQKLVEVAVLLRECFRQSDIIGRLGGDEFCILLSDSGQNGDLLARKRLMQLVSRNNENSERRYALSISLGMVSVNGPRERFSQVRVLV